MRSTRALLGVTQAEAAAARNVTLATYRKYEAGAPQHSGVPIFYFVETYGVSFDWIALGIGVGIERVLH